MNSEDQVDDTDKLITQYFSLGFHQKEIISFLRILHGRTMSLRTLKRRLVKLNLFRRRNYTKIEEVVNFLENELNKSSQLHGYKWMHLRCLQNDLVVTQQTVRDLLNVLDPEGVQLRRKRRLRRRQYYSKGPNYVWHVDSYDKLKPYGICISGCIDGFSRHIIWLRAGPTASDPKVIAGYFLDAIKLANGCPEILRSDMGTENGTMEKMQKGLHELFDDPSSNRQSFIYGKSTHNQRIEAWWSTLRRHNSQFWMNLFQMLKDDNLFTASFLDKSLIQFCFMALIQNELDQVSLEWNVHRIRKTKNAIAPAGRPAVMYEMPSLYGVNNYLLKIPSFLIEPLSSECTIVQAPCDKDFYDLCSILMVENNLVRSSDPYVTIDLYTKLRNKLIPLFH